MSLTASASMPLAADPKRKGTLACVVLKAKNLPNKKSIGKQDPFAVLSMGTEKQKTKPDKRGGQHPTWDEQLHFEIYDDVEDVVSGQPSSSSTVKKSGGKQMLRVACYADDNKEPDLIGEGMVDLTDVLKTGEFDEWVTIRHKDRYCGEVYLELTFFSAAPRPKRSKKPRQPLTSTTGTYGGAGTFSADVDEQPYPAIPASMRPAAGGQHQKVGSSGSTSALSSRLDHPPSMRASSSMAGIATYTPPYAPAAAVQRAPSPQPIRHQHGSSLSTSMTMPALQDDRRRNSFSSASNARPETSSMYVGPPSQPQYVEQPQPSYGQFPQSQSTASVATVRPASNQAPYPPSQAPNGYDPMSGLMSSMSSMSMNHASSSSSSGKPVPPPTSSQGYAPYGQPPTQAYQPAVPPGTQPYQHQPSYEYAASSGQPPSTPSYQHHPDSQQPQYAAPPPHHEQRPQPVRTPSHSYIPPATPTYSQTQPPKSPYQQQYQQSPYAPPPQQEYQHPHPPHSQPPTPAAHEYHHGQQQPPPRPQSSQQIHPAQTFIPSGAKLPTPGEPQPSRPYSPAAPPLRPMSSGGYHALPPLPAARPGSVASYRAHSPVPETPNYQQQPYHPQHGGSVAYSEQPSGPAPPPPRGPSPAPSHNSYAPSSSYYGEQPHQQPHTYDAAQSSHRPPSASPYSYTTQEPYHHPQQQQQPHSPLRPASSSFYGGPPPQSQQQPYQPDYQSQRRPSYSGPSHGSTTPQPGQQPPYYHGQQQQYQAPPPAQSYGVPSHYDQQQPPPSPYGHPPAGQSTGGHAPSHPHAPHQQQPYSYPPAQDAASSYGGQGCYGQQPPQRYYS